MEITKRDHILEEVEKAISWLYNNVTGQVNENTLKKAISSMLFISTSMYSYRLSMEQYKVVLMCVGSYKKYSVRPLTVYMQSFLGFVEMMCKTGISTRTREKATETIPKDTLLGIVGSPSDFGAEIHRAANEIYDAGDEVSVLRKLLREREAIYHLRHSRLKILLQKRREEKTLESLKNHNS